MDITFIPYQLLYLGLLLLSASFMGKMFARIGVGEVIGQILGGVLVSPYLLIYLGIMPAEYLLAFKSFKFLMFVFLGLIAFSIGEELHYERIKKAGRESYLICFMQAIISFILVTCAFLILGFKPIIALIIGSIGVATAPAALFVLMKKMSIEGEIRTKLANIVVVNDIFGIILFSIFVQLVLSIGKENFHVGRSVLKLSYGIGIALLIGVIIFVFLKLLIRETKFESTPAPDKAQADLGFLRFVFEETPTPSVEIFLILVGLIIVGSAIAWNLHLPFLLTVIMAGFLVANYHTRRLFDSLFIGNVSQIINLIFFGLIGSTMNFTHLTSETVLFSIVYIIARGTGKIGGTIIGCKITRQDPKVTQTLSMLMLPQAGVTAVEVAFVALVLPEGQIILQIIIPAMIFFEIVGILISEQTFKRWKTWVIGETQALAYGKSDVEKIMLLTTLLKEHNVKITLVAENKAEAINELLELLVSTGEIKNAAKARLFKEFMEREKIQSTGIGDNVAIPHIRSNLVGQTVCGLGIKKGEGIDFDAIDKEPVNIIFLFISPEEDRAGHLKLLSEISFICRKEENRKVLKTMSKKKDIVMFFKKLNE